MAVKPVRVLVGFAESLAAIESVWCLLDAGCEVTAFTRAGRRPALAAARGVRIIAVPAPEADVAACAAAVAGLVRAHRPDAVLPLDDAAVAVCDRLPDDAPVAGPRGTAAGLALDKREQLDLAAKAGFLVPETQIRTPDGVQPDAVPGTGPWMVKGALAGTVRDGRLVRPAGAVARSAAEVSRIVDRLDGPALVQPLLHGTGEGVFGLAVDGDAHALSAHRRVRMMNPRGSGSSACRSIPLDPDVVAPTRQFLRLSGWHGLFMIELLRDGSGRPWFMELNGRTWGSMALARRRGFPYPAWAVRSRLEPGWRPTPPVQAPHLLCRHLGRELVHLLAVLRGARGADPDGWPSRRATVAALLRRSPDTRWYNVRPGDRSVLVRDTWQTVAEQLRRRR